MCRRAAASGARAARRAGELYVATLEANVYRIVPDTTAAIRGALTP